MSDEQPLLERRTLLKGAMVMAGVAGAAQQIKTAAAQPVAGTRLEDAKLSPNRQGDRSNWRVPPF